MAEQPIENYDQMFDPNMLPPSNSQEDIWFRSETFRALEKMLEDKVVDERLKDSPLWATAVKSMKLTFFDESDKTALENLFEAENCKFLRSLPPNGQDISTTMDMGQTRMIFMANVRRSYGTPVSKMNERIAIISQMKINSSDGFNGSSKKGIMAKLFGLG